MAAARGRFGRVTRSIDRPPPRRIGRRRARPGFPATRCRQATSAGARYFHSVMTEVELHRLKQIERRACALRDRLRERRALLSDPEILRRAEELCEDAKAAVRGYVAGRPD